MKHSLLELRNLCLTLVILATAPATVLSAENLPAEKAGTIGKPQGKIAFIREGNVWVMTPSGANQEMVCEVTNADGRLSWSPDGKNIMFTRAGRVDFKAPDFTGGFYKVYDIFLASLDSAYHNNRLYWRRITTDMGSRDPEWSADGSKVIFTKDMNANLVNSYEPNYQVCIMDPEGVNIELLRKDWQGQEEFLIAPSMNTNGDIACVNVYEKRQQGMVVLSKDKYMIPMDTVKALALRNSTCVAPSWSGDGKWLAYINNDLTDGGLYITSPDLKERYLVFTPPPTTSLHTVSPSFSPDSKWLTFSTADGSIWICDITGKGARRLSGPGADKFPVWSKNP
jgi:Tol biopolymer transport system component